MANFAARNPEVFTVGFALAERGGEELIQIARQKMQKKKLAVVVANSLLALGSDETEVHFVTASEASVLKGSKKQVSIEIIARVADAILGDNVSSRA